MYLPCRLSVPKSESWTLRLALAAHPPELSVSNNLNSFTHTSPLFKSAELLRTPIIMVFTSPSVGLPNMETLLLGWSVS